MRFLFRLSTGRDFTDTQTGLRAIPADFMRELLSCPGERFEFETHMLLRLKGRKVVQVPIETLYIDGNRETHFDPFRDSLKISAIIVWAGLRKLMVFALASGLSFGVDIGLFTWFYYRVFGEDAFGRLFFSVALARVVSVFFNYCCNRYLVFGESHDGRRFNLNAFGRYLVLAVFILAASYILTGVFHALFTQVALPWVKGCVDLALFLMSSCVQRLAIFRYREA
jgi:putative flippase GtrA